MSRPRPLVVLLALLIAVLAGCSKKDKPQDTAQLPGGPTLVTDASGAMRDVQSAHVVIASEGEVTGLPVKRADGDLRRDGDAKGTITLEQLGQLVEYQFVVLGETIYLKGATGGWLPLPASVAVQAAQYDPSAILDPDRGVVKVLATASEATTEAEETIDGRSTYRVAAKLDPTTAAALVPGVGPGVTSKLWLDKESKKLRRAVLTIPAADGKSGTVTIDFTDFDKPVTVSAP